MKVAIVFLCKYPSKGTLDFANKIGNDTADDVYVISDELYNESTLSNVSVLSIPDELCLQSGYMNSNIGSDVTHIKKNPIAYDKALYHFSLIDRSYDFVLFLEDDVLVQTTDTIKKFIDKYVKYDLVTPQNFFKDNNWLDWHWKHVVDKISPPYYYSMVCACGMSRIMLDVIHEYVCEKNTLFYIESMFNTLAMQNNLKVIDAPELKSIVWMGDWDFDDYLLLPNNFFHPVKNPDNHVSLRHVIQELITEQYTPIDKLPPFIIKT
jgi:hypothetical protein